MIGLLAAMSANLTFNVKFAGLSASVWGDFGGPAYLVSVLTSVGIDAVLRAVLFDPAGAGTGLTTACSQMSPESQGLVPFDLRIR